MTAKPALASTIWQLGDQFAKVPTGGSTRPCQAIWPHVEGAGTNIADYVPSSSNALTLTGGTWGTDTPGAIVDFNGSSDRENLAADVLGVTTGPVALEVLFKCDAWGSWMNLAGKGSVASGSFTNYELLINTTGGLAFAVNDGVGGFSITSYYALSTGTWYHAVGVRVYRSLMLYVDGVLQSSALCPATLINPATSLFAVGCGNHGGTNDYYFDGKVAHAAVYGELSAEDVRHLYNDSWRVVRPAYPTGPATPIFGAHIGRR